MTELAALEDEEFFSTPIMHGVPAAISTAEGAISTFSPDFAGLMVGADHVPGVGAVLVVGVLQRDQQFVCGATTVEHWRCFQQRLGETIDRLESGEFDKAVAAS